jgi:hypothetical protein
MIICLFPFSFFEHQIKIAPGTEVLPVVSGQRVFAAAGL